MAKLTLHDKNYCRKLRDKGMPAIEIARMFKVAQSTMSGILNDGQSLVDGRTLNGQFKNAENAELNRYFTGAINAALDAADERHITTSEELVQRLANVRLHCKYAGARSSFLRIWNEALEKAMNARQVPARVRSRWTRDIRRKAEQVERKDNVNGRRITV